MREPEWCRNGWDEIIPGLFMGGHYMAAPGDPTRGIPVVVTDQFDVVFSLFETDLHDCGPDIEVPNLLYRIPDGKLTQFQRESVGEFAGMVVRALRGGLKVLVRCQAGLNRSGYVVASALMQMGFSVEAAVIPIRARRSPDALFNQYFLDYLGYCEQQDSSRD